MPFKRYFPARLSLALLCATGVMELYMTRLNLSIAIVDMVQTVTADSGENEPPKTPYCLREDDDELFLGNSTLLNSTNGYEYSIIHNDSLSLEDNLPERTPKIRMTSIQRGNVLSAFFYSYGLSAVLGGRLAEMYGTKRVFGVGVFVDGVANFLTPISAKTSTELLITLRVILGFFQGMCYPSLNSLAAKWIPPDETSRFVSFSFLSNMIGTILTFSVSGIIISEIGWEWTFYISGCLSFTWLIIWTLFMFDTPEKHPRISEEEKRYILEAKEAAKRCTKNKVRKMPWIKMLTSMPVWAIVGAAVGNIFGLSVYVTQLPIYLSSILGMNIRNNGFLSALPFLARYLGANGFSWLSNFTMKRISLHPKTWKIILTIIGFGGPAFSVIMVGYVGCSATAALCFFILGLGLNGAIVPGYIINSIEIVPNFAGTVAGLSSLIGFLVGMVAPVIIGALTPEETLSEWITVYWVCSAIYLGTGTFYCIFASTDVQPWNDEEETELKQNVEQNSGNEVENNKENLLEEKI